MSVSYCCLTTMNARRMSDTFGGLGHFVPHICCCLMGSVGVGGKNMECFAGRAACPYELVMEPSDL